MSFAYDKVIDPITITSNQELALALGAKTLVQLTGAAAFQIFGLAQVGGNVDGAVVTFVNVSGGSTTSFTCVQESTSASALVDRFRNPSLVNISTGTFYGSITYRYDSTPLRWVLLSHT